MQVHMEYLGVSRLVIGKKAEVLTLPDGSTFRDLVRFLAETYPDLVGYVIRSGEFELEHPNIFNLDGKRMVRRDQMDEPIADGEQVVLMSMSAGG